MAFRGSTQIVLGAEDLETKDVSTEDGGHAVASCGVFKCVLSQTEWIKVIKPRRRDVCEQSRKPRATESTVKTGSE